jgi:hypothetical protein
LPCGKVRYTSESSAIGAIFAVFLAVTVLGVLLSGYKMPSHSDHSSYSNIKKSLPESF